VRVDPEKPYTLIYSLLEHSQLGYLIEPFIVQLNEQDHLTFTNQRIFTKTLELFKEVITDEDLEIIKILDEFDNEYITRRFYKDKKKIRPSEFFQKHCTPELIQNHIKPFIERRMQKVLPMLTHRQFYLQGIGSNPAAYKLTIATEPSSVLFHFRKNEYDTRYFATIKNAGQKIDFMQNSASIICNEPAWLLLNRTLFFFEEGIDGKKLTPFINKKFILVPKSAEEKFYSTFVTKVIEKYDVYAEGFAIDTVSNNFVSELQLQQKLDGNYHFVLYFNYSIDSVHYLSARDVLVRLVHKEEEIHFERLKRFFKLEQKIVSILKENSLDENLENGFECKSTDLSDLIAWVTEHHDVLAANHIAVKQTQEKKFVFAKTRLEINVSKNNDWFDVQAMVKFGDYEIPFIRLRNHILKSIKEFILPDGTVAVIPEEWFARYATLFRLSEQHDDEIKIKAYNYSLIDELQNDSMDVIKHPLVLSPDKIIPPVPLPKHLNATLRPYQKHGFDWFYFLQQYNIGGILADDMGLGKTLQTLTLLQKEKEDMQASNEINKDDELTKQEEADDTIIPEDKAMEEVLRQTVVQLDIFGLSDLPENSGKTVTEKIEDEISIPKNKKAFRRTSLIIVPSSLVYNWYSEAKKFTPKLRLYIHSGIQRVKSEKIFSLYDVVITTYGVLRKDIDLFKRVNFHYIILDEGQAIKNASSLVAQSVYELHSRHKLVLTGTPIENTLRDLWSQLHFLNPKLLGTLNHFNQHYTIPIEKNNITQKLDELKVITRPFLLRRTKELVAPDLPDKADFIVYCDMTDEQREMYERVKSEYRNEIIKTIAEDGFSKSKLQVLTGLMKLRQIANHPLLHDAIYKNESGKFNDIVEKAESVISEDHKLLLFSQFTSYLGLFKKHFDKQKIPYAYLDGTLTPEQRRDEVDKFQNESNIKVFLISLKAGGIGLNLTAADYVFLADPWWNPAIEEQAISRAHRIGQEKKVFIYKFISRNTLEEKIVGLQQRKSQLAKEITDSDENFFKFLDEKEVKGLFE
jgi:SNF2 family DNA or RNA helicase